MWWHCLFFAIVFKFYISRVIIQPVKTVFSIWLIKIKVLSETAEAYSNDLRERVIRSYESGMSEEEIINIFIIGSDTLNRRIRKYKETGSFEPYRRTKFRAKKIHWWISSWACPEKSFSDSWRKSVFLFCKASVCLCGNEINRDNTKKRLFSVKKETTRKEMNFVKK